MGRTNCGHRGGAPIVDTTVAHHLWTQRWRTNSGHKGGPLWGRTRALDKGSVAESPTPLLRLWNRHHDDFKAKTFRLWNRHRDDLKAKTLRLWNRHRDEFKAITWAAMACHWRPWSPTSRHDSPWADRASHVIEGILPRQSQDQVTAHSGHAALSGGPGIVPGVGALRPNGR